ncbi:MAG: lysophospholipase [Kofleriaceae bacterium]|nr:lysophospholipase [Kofleriaceae bacterium]
MLTPTSGIIATRTGALYSESFCPAAPRGVVLITHGYAEHCGRYHELANILVGAGWAVQTYDVRGHGKSPGPRGYIDRFATYIGDFEAAKAQARTLCPSGPLVVLGHSNGGLITLAALVGGAKADAAVISSPFLGLKLAVSPIKRLLGRIASVVYPGLTLPAPLDVAALTSDPAKQQARRSDALCFDIATARWFTEAANAQRSVAQGIETLTMPSLWLIGGADKIADADASVRIAKRAPQATVHRLAGMQHEVFNETDRAGVFTTTTEYLKSI